MSRLVVLLSFLALVNAINLVDQKLQLKTGSMLGSVGISIAQWDLEFDQDLYYFIAPGCAPGLTQDSLTFAGVAADPCWAGCNFAPSDPAECGRPFNTTDPTCQTICDNHPHKSTLCNYADRPWHVLEPDVESPLINLTVGPTLYLRWNWLLIEQGFRFEGLPTVGQVAGSAVALMDYSAELEAETYCVGVDSPDPYANGCPSAQCFRYGTWEWAGYVNADKTLDDYTATSSFVLRSFARPQPNVRRTQPRSDAPETFNLSALSDHIPLQFGVTVDVSFGPFEDFVFYQLTTTYCGMINIQYEKAEWTRLTASIVIGVSVDGNPYPVDIFSDIMFLDGAMKPMWICPTDSSEPAVVFFAACRYTSSDDDPLSYSELHYLTVDYYRPDDDWRQFRLGATAEESDYSRYTHFPPLATWSTGLASNLFRLSCPNDVNATEIDYYDCRAGSALYGTCLDFAFGLPADPWTISLLPVPEVVRAANPEGFGNIDYPPDHVTRGQRVSAFFILETSIDGSVISQPLGANWTTLWTQCELHIGSGSPVGTIDGDWLTADLLLEPMMPECNYSEFKHLSEEITSAIQSMGQNTFEAYSERVQIDEMTFHDPWQACNDFVQSELSHISATEVNLLGSVTCLTDDLSDPCCNHDLSWTECCAPRDVTTTLEAFVQNANATEEICNYASCVEPLLEEYYRAVLNNQVGGCAGPDLSAKLRAPIRAYHDCREAAFGNDYDMPSCVLDSDCTSLVANTSISCNQVTKQCVFNFEDAVMYFFECLAENLPIEPRIKLIALNNWKIKEQSDLAPFLKQQYGQSSECVDEAFGVPWSRYDAFFITEKMLGGCADCSYIATDVSYQTPPWCDIREGSLCSYDWGVYSPLLGCETAVCNWDHSYDCDTGLVGTSFCGVCESESVCAQVTDVGESDCTNLPSICFLADGTNRTDLTSEQCAETFTCTQLCDNGSACTGEATCNATGYCEPDDDIYLALTNSSWNNVTITGYCTIPLQPFNSPECSDSFPGSLPTSYGCVVYGDCWSLTYLNCTPNYYTEELCLSQLASFNPEWWPRYGDQDKCLSKYGCKEDLVGLRSLSSLGTRLRSPKNQEQCSMCDGELQPLAEWVPGRWLPGTPRTPQWIERALVSRYSLTESVDFITLYEDIYASARAAVAFQLQNNIQCSYQTINTLLKSVSCACTSSDLSSECFPNEYITSVGLGQACPLTSNTIIAPPAKFSYTGDDVSAELQGQCVEFNIDRINARFFYGLAPPPISTGFVPALSIRGWNAVVNENGALVGQVIGDGIDIHFTSNGDSLLQLNVCLLISTYIPIETDQPFSVYSLGYWTGKTNPATAIPFSNLNNVSVVDGYVCAVVTLPHTGEDISFVPILRRPDWQEQPSPRFSSGQKALLYVVASFYAILCFVIVVQTVRLAHVGAWNFTVATNYIWVLLFFMTVIRAIYIYLVAADVLGQQNSHLLVDFWMMDLPTLLFLICNSIIALSFLFLLMATKDEKYQSRVYFWITLAVVISFIVAIFVAILLAFNYAVVDTQGAHGPALCSTYTDNSAAARAIRITYECLLFAVALTIAIISAVIAAMLWWNLREQEGTASLLTLGSVSSFGILSDSLAFLIYYIVNNPTPYFAIVLIFTEILPITFLVIQVSSKQITNTKRSTQSGRQHGISTSSDGGPGTYTRSRHSNTRDTFA